MNERTNAIIRPEKVAAKLEAVRNFEQPEVLDEITAEPRLVELLWFLQYVSRGENYAGGLHKFSRDLIASSMDLIGTPTMGQLGNDDYSAEARKRIENETPLRFDRETHAFLEAVCGTPSVAAAVTERSLKSKAELKEICASSAEEMLPSYLEALCHNPSVRFTRPIQGGGWRGRQAEAPWYFARVAVAVLRFMDQRRDQVEQTIAETEISREIFRWLRKAGSLRGQAIQFIGNSRFGKTEAIRAFSAMHPGRIRLVDTKSGGGEGELLISVAAALGIEFGPKQRGHQLRSLIEYVLRESGLGLIFEESHLLFPATYRRNAMPARLNWVRRSVIDAKVACVLVTTPQAHSETLKGFLKATDFAIEQWEERVLTRRLPTEIGEDDLLAIARIHLPDVPESLVQIVVQAASATERNYCSDVSRIALIARSNAQDSGREVPNLADIREAMAMILPPAVTTRAEPQQKRCKAPASRAVVPAGDVPEPHVNRLTFAEGTASPVHAGGIK